MSVKVFIDAVCKTEWQLYTKIYGEFDDNLAIIVNKQPRKDITAQRHNSPSPISQWYDGNPDVQEFVLTSEYDRILGINEETDYWEAKQSEFSYLVHFHDNFIFYCSPLDNEILQAWLNAIFDLHNFYFKRDLNWENLKNDLLTQIPFSKDIKLRSYPEKNTVTLSYKRSYKGFWSFMRKEYEEIVNYVVDKDIVTGRPS